MPSRKETSKSRTMKSAQKKTATRTAPSRTAGSKTSRKTNTPKSLKTQKNDTPTKNKTYFKMINQDDGTFYGRYTGDTPKQAASKGYTKMLRKMKADGLKPPKKSIIFLRESTRGKARKIYGYEAWTQKLPEPQIVELKDKKTGEVYKTIVHNYRNKAKKVPVPDQIGGCRVVKIKRKKGGVKTVLVPIENEEQQVAKGKKNTKTKPVLKDSGSKSAATKKTGSKKTGSKRVKASA